mgnify:CR=1 FL=1
MVQFNTRLLSVTPLNEITILEKGSNKKKCNKKDAVGIRVHEYPSKTHEKLNQACHAKYVSRIIEGLFDTIKAKRFNKISEVTCLKKSWKQGFNVVDG